MNLCKRREYSPAKYAERLRAKATGEGVSRLSGEHADYMILGVKKGPSHSVETSKQGKPDHPPLRQADRKEC